MTMHTRLSTYPLSGLRVVLITLLIVGVVFRFVNLDYKLYWHDEVYTTIRATGYTRQEIEQGLFQNRVILAKELQQFQQIKPGSTPADTIHSLVIEDPQHPPLYFLMTRFWMQAFGDLLPPIFHSPLTVSRSLPALLSLLSLPFIYGLGWELFNSRLAALLATTFLALSPFDILFAQTARQYSLFTVMVIASHYFLLRAVQLSEQQKPSNDSKQSHLSWKPWALYAFAAAIGLYTHPLFGLTIAGHVVYMMLEFWLNKRSKARTNTIQFFWLSLVAANLFYSPWLLVMLLNRQQVMLTTDWVHVSPGIDYLLNQWVLSFTTLFLDLGFNHPWTFLLRMLILLLIGTSLFALYRCTSRSAWLFVFTSLLMPFLLLVLPDLLMGGQRSAISRYLISCYPSIQLAVAYFLSTQLSPHFQSANYSPNLVKRSYRPDTLHPVSLFAQPWLWQGTLALLFTTSLISCTTSMVANTWWCKDASYFNAGVAYHINAAPAPIVLSDRGNDLTNTGELISLSYLLHGDVRLSLLSQDARWVGTEDFESQVQDAIALVFRPSDKLRQVLERDYGKLQLISAEGSLWQLPQQK